MTTICGTRYDYFIPGWNEAPPRAKTDNVIRAQGRVVVPRTIKVMDTVKKKGHISLMDLSRELGLGIGATLNAIQNATIAEGSRIYEEVIEGSLWYGWLEF